MVSIIVGVVTYILQFHSYVRCSQGKYCLSFTFIIITIYIYPMKFSLINQSYLIIKLLIYHYYADQSHLWFEFKYSIHLFIFCCFQHGQACFVAYKWSLVKKDRQEGYLIIEQYMPACTWFSANCLHFRVTQPSTSFLSHHYLIFLSLSTNSLVLLTTHRKIDRLSISSIICIISLGVWLLLYRDVAVKMTSVVIRYCKFITELRRESHSYSENND